ncbi:MAG TPA: phosphotransferase [Candidatus Binataceae bacterium]|nr:phosphotransferase [Candidatus Binataceae bacterium]
MAGRIGRVTDSVESTPAGWIAEVTARLWPGSLAVTSPLRGDASARRFWRVNLDGSRQAPVSAIAINLGPDDLPLYVRALKLLPEPISEPPWLNVHRFLCRIGVAVPEIYAADVLARMLLVEDVGSLSLFEAALTGNAGDLYRLAVDELLLFHLIGTHNLDGNCISGRIVYDRLLFRWELEQFLEAGLAEIAPGANRQTIGGEFDDLCSRLDRFPRVFSHRDYYGNNLFVQIGQNGNPRIRVIDFQDALMAPAGQDLAVLLTTRDAARVITPKLERRLLDYYYAALVRRAATPGQFEQFHESYRLCVLQHALKVIGRFIVLEHQGKAGYRQYIPYALEQAKRMLRPGEFPLLQRALGK